MKIKTFTSTFHVYAFEELDPADQALITAAQVATKGSYAPYSQFRVGAAARLADGTIVTGNNQENAAYPSGLCAERTTLFYANAQFPHQSVTTLAVAARNAAGFLARPIPPCGACRQVMLEVEQRFARPLRILLYGREEIYICDSISHLLPLSFGSETLTTP